jgi:molybdopterin-guanine dinucleotide biosynthesis protein B
VKSIHHDIEPDDPGTDTHRHREAGADTVVGVTPSHTFEVTAEGKGEPSGESDAASERAALARVLDRLSARDHDVVLVEGFSSVAVPTIVVGERKDGVRGEIIATDEEPVAAIAERIEQLDPMPSTRE